MVIELLEIAQQGFSTCLMHCHGTARTNKRIAFLGLKHPQTGVPWAPATGHSTFEKLKKNANSLVQTTDRAGQDKFPESLNKQYV